MNELGKQIQEIIEKELESSMLEQVIADEFRESISKCIHDEFNMYGDIRTAINDKIKTTIVPYIERADFSAYLPKLDTVLIELIKSTTLPDNDEEFDDIIIDMLQSAPYEGTEGLLAFMNFVLMGYEDLRDRLQYYEDLIEQGQMMKLPVPEGATVWKINYQRRGDEIYYYDIQPCKFRMILLERFGDTVFKTKAEAQLRLVELEVSDE